MRPRDRFLAALHGERADRTPLANVAALVPAELQEETGCFMPEAHLDPEKLARLCHANHEVLGLDGVSFIINYFNEPAALGAKMSWGSKIDLPTYASHPWSRIEDAAAPADLLDRVPLKSNLEALRIAKRNHGEHVAVIGKVMGPLSMTQAMHGVERTMLGLFDEPRKIAHFIDVSTEILIRSANAQLDLGIDAVLIGEGGAGAKMLSPAMYDEFLAAAHRRMTAEIRGPTILHMCGDITPRLPSLRKLGLTCFNFDWAIDPALMKREAAGEFRIMGNVSTSDLLVASPAAIEKQVVACLDAGVDIISPGCAVSPACPKVNLLAMRSAIEKWSGRPS